MLCVLLTLYVLHLFSAHGFLSKGQAINSEEVAKERDTAFFLATQDSIKNSLVAELRKITGYVDVLHEIASQCALMFEKKRYVLPEEKHMLVRVCIHT